MDKTRFSFRFNRKNKLNKQGLAPIQLECLLNKKRRFFDTKIKVSPNDWDKNKSRIKSSHNNYIKLNQRLNQILTEFEEFELSFLNAKKPFNLAMFDLLFTQNNKLSFNEFYSIELNNNSLSEATKKSHQSTLNRLNEFRKNIAFDEVNFEFLHDFERFLKSSKCDIIRANKPPQKLSQNTIHKYFKNIKTYINLAINKGHISLNDYPFRKFKVKKIESEKIYLTPYEIEKIENLILGGENLKYQVVKDLFLFSVYTGLRYSDVISLGIKNIITKNGEKWIIKTAIKNINKTEIPVKIPIDTLFNGKANDIILKYWKLGNSNIFPQITNQHLNRSLKIIARLCGINKNITFHSARHTTATYLLYKGANITTIQKILGHSKITTTQIYSHILEDTILNDLKAISF